MTRREFIQKLMYIALITGVYPVLSYKDALSLGGKEVDGAEKYITGCLWCQSGCTMIVYIRDGKVVHITGNPEDPVTKGRICIKPLGTLEILNSPQRIKYPMKRIGDRFVKLSWDEALDEIAFKLKKLRDEYGGHVLGIWASGRSSFDGRLVNKAFAKLYGTPNWEKTGPFCNYSAKIAGKTTTGTRHTPWIYEEGDFYSADLYIFVGSNMAATRPVIFSNILEEKRKRGCKLICIDPRQSETAKWSDEWISIRPGTDLALALGMAHYIISENLYDEEFVRKHTKGFEKFKSELMKRNYNIEWASKVTGIPKEKIIYLAKLYVNTKKAIIIGNSGISHHTNAVQTHRAWMFLTALTGHYGYPSTGYGCLNNGGTKIGSIPVPKHAIPQTPPSLGKNPVMWLMSLESEEFPYKLKALISTGSPLTQWPEQEKIRKWISQLELSVWNGIVPSINVKYFQYILPAATWIEAGTIAPVSDDSRFALVPKLIDPPGEAKPDRWWWIELAKRFGWEKYIPEKLKDWKELINYACGRYGYSVEDFLKEKATHALRAPKNRKTLFIGGKFHTSDKKFHFVSSESKFKVYGLSSFPEFYVDPDIALPEETTLKYENKLIPSPFQKGKCLTRPVKLVKKEKSEEKFCLNLITGRPSEAIMGDATHWSKMLARLSPNQVCVIHPGVAKRLNISTGEKVKVVSPYGETFCLAVVSEGIREDTVFVPYSYGANEPFSHWKSINFVTNCSALCPISGQVAFKGVRVCVEKI